MRRGRYPILGFLGLIVHLLVPSLGPHAQSPPPAARARRRL